MTSTPRVKQTRRASEQMNALALGRNMTPDKAYSYAAYILRKRWPTGEPVILTDPKWAFYYARDIIAGRWPEAEPIIRAKPEYALQYALRIIRGRWPECEEAMAKSGDFACDYAINVLNSRFIPGERAMLRCPNTHQRYFRHFSTAKEEWVANGWLPIGDWL